MDEVLPAVTVEFVRLFSLSLCLSSHVSSPFQAYYTRKSGSIGQMLSHILLAERFKASDLSALLVFEDDALPPASVSQYAVFDASV